MLDPDAVLAAIVSASRDIPLLIVELGSTSFITGHTFTFGVENSLARSIEAMSAGSLLWAYQDLLGGGAQGFNGAEIWKHRLQAYIRPKNHGSSPAHVWWLLMNKPLTSSGQNLRYTHLLNHALSLPETPTLTFQQDAMQTDLFVGSVVWPESGDD